MIKLAQDDELCELELDLFALIYDKKNESRGIVRMCEQVAASGNTLILYSA